MQFLRVRIRCQAPTGRTGEGRLLGRKGAEEPIDEGKFLKGILIYLKNSIYVLIIGLVSCPLSASLCISTPSVSDFRDNSSKHYFNSQLVKKKKNGACMHVRTDDEK